METFAAVCLAMMLAASPPPATLEEHPPKGKDVCLLYHHDCPGRKDDIYQRIDRLKREVARGSEVYTPEELKKLERMLAEYEYLLDILLYHNTK